MVEIFATNQWKNNDELHVKDRRCVKVTTNAETLFIVVNEGR